MATPPLSDTLARQAIEAYERHKRSNGAAAAELGLSLGTFRDRVKVAKKRGMGTWSQMRETVHGNAPDYDLNHPVPEPYIMRGTSTLYGKDGSLKLQWVKTKLDQDALDAAMRAAVEALAEATPRAIPVIPPPYTLASLCNVYTLTDCHVGQKSWGKETGGADWDLEIAEQVLRGAFDYLLEASPHSETCVIAQLGDFLHIDGLESVTPTNRNLLDSDSRFSKIVKTAIRILRGLVDRALIKHQRVEVVIAEGNHDIASAVWLRHLFALLYENEPRVRVIDSEMPYYVMQHGKTMLAWHHGHLKKNDGLPLLFAAQFPIIWGATTKRYCHTGHRHHEETKEHSGMKVTQHSTLAARDAYAARGGWLSEREIKSITYHSEFGQVAVNTVTPEMLG